MFNDIDNSLNEFDSRIRRYESSSDNKIDKKGKLINNFISISPDLHDE